MCLAFYVPVGLNYLPFLPRGILSSLHSFDGNNSSAQITLPHYFITYISVQLLPIYQGIAQPLLPFENYFLFLSVGDDLLLIHAK